MKWYLLKSNKCPKCTSYLTGTETLLNCSKPNCDFKIGVEKFAQISNEQVQKYKRKDKFDDLSGWNKFET